MLSDEAAVDNWTAWLDDLPLDAGFAEGIGRVQDFISALQARAEAAEAALASAYMAGRDDAAAACDWGDIYGDNAVRSIRALPVPADLAKRVGVGTNWRDDPDAIVEDDEPQVGRDYA